MGRAPSGVVLRDVPRERPALRLTVASLCTWEAVAITTRRIPTLSHGMSRLPLIARAAVWGAAALVLTDHFFTRRFT